MADVFSAATVCLGAMSELTPPQRLRLISVLRAAIDLGDEHVPGIVGEVTLTKEHVGELEIRVKKPARSIKTQPKAEPPKAGQPGWKSRSECRRMILESLRTSRKTRAQLAMAIGVGLATSSFNNAIATLSAERRIEKAPESDPRCAVWMLSATRQESPS